MTSRGIGLAELETFLAVVAEGSFSRAARNLHLSQPAVTTRVQKLEQTLGVRLLVRTTRSVELTTAGEALARETKDALQGLHRVVARMLEESGKSRRRVTVAATPMVAALLLPPALQRWRLDHPNLQVVVRDMRHYAALESLDRGEVDLAIIAIDEPIPRFDFQLILDDEVVVLVPKDHDLSARPVISLVELVSHPVMMLEHYIGIHADLERACRIEGLKFAPSLVAANLQTIIGMLDTGAGLAVLPRVMATHTQSQVRHCLTIDGVRLRRRYGILTRRDNELGPSVRTFCDFLHSHWLSDYRA